MSHVSQNLTYLPGAVPGRSDLPGEGFKTHETCSKHLKVMLCDTWDMFKTSQNGTLHPQSASLPDLGAPRVFKKVKNFLCSSARPYHGHPEGAVGHAAHL